MSLQVSKRLSKLERTLNTDEKTRMDVIELERAVLFRTRLEGGTVWFEAGGHVLYPLNHPRTRKAFCAMLEAQDTRIEGLIHDALDYCLEVDPYQLDANYPLLEYYLWTVLNISVSDQPFRPLALDKHLTLYAPCGRRDSRICWGTSRRRPVDKQRRRGVLLSFAFFFGLILSLVVLGIAAAFLGRLLTRWSVAFAIGTGIVSLAAGLAAIFGPALRSYVPDPETPTCAFATYRGDASTPEERLLLTGDAFVH
ncbi:MAG TPA: hypothetical protein VKM94_11010 [Blastocatellia bacterium]|nr:hypothetical protein [Blastocatellia bacterium]